MLPSIVPTRRKPFLAILSTGILGFGFFFATRSPEEHDLDNEVIGPQKPERLAGLAASHPDAAIGVLVDSLFGVDALSAAMRARAPSATISAYVEIECGQERCAMVAYP